MILCCECHIHRCISFTLRFACTSTSVHYSCFASFSISLHLSFGYIFLTHCYLSASCVSAIWEKKVRTATVWVAVLPACEYVCTHTCMYEKVLDCAHHRITVCMCIHIQLRVRAIIHWYAYQCRRCDHIVIGYPNLNGGFPCSQCWMLSNKTFCCWIDFYLLFIKFHSFLVGNFCFLHN